MADVPADGVNITTLNHLNQTLLEYFNYTAYANGTISNGSSCNLLFDNYAPTLYPNGTWINGTSCYFPYYPLETRGTLGIVFASFFSATIMFTLINLAKHGRLYLPQEKRFRAIGRRWQWYWMLFIAACGILSSISAIDVDRDYLQNIAIILENFFFYLMVPGTLACIWEGVRHWGSWQERQIYDYDPFSLPQTDRRGQTEFFMPLIFYAFAWLDFFMVVPRSWSGLEKQGSAQMTNLVAIPSATDSRFKAGGFLALVAWCITVYHLRHSIHYYKPRNRGPFWSLIGFFRHTPIRFLLTLPLSLVLVCYTLASSFSWTINIGNQNANPGYIYGLGYAPILLIMIINEIGGFIQPNEDRDLIRQRAERGQAIDSEIGLRKKPAWWRQHGAYALTADERLRNLTSEVGGGRATAHNIGSTMELGNMPTRPLDLDAENPFKDTDEYSSSDKEPLKRPGLVSADSYGDDSSRGISRSTTTTLGAKPQVIKSMLDF